MASFVGLMLSTVSDVQDICRGVWRGDATLFRFVTWTLVNVSGGMAAEDVKSYESMWFRYSQGKYFLLPPYSTRANEGSGSR